MANQAVLLSGGALVVALLTLAFVWRLGRVLDTRANEAVETDQLTSALGRSLNDIEFEKRLVRIEDRASEMRELHTDLERVLRAPQARGQFGEQQLETILRDHLPPGMYGIREQVVDGKTPDAYIDSSAGKICIDSKFPLDNYEKFLDADGEDERERHRRTFRADVERQLEKIERDYVRPEHGTVDFAFAFVPSESVYYHLVTEEYDLLRGFTRRGVQVVSPLTVGQKLELIRADVHAKQLSERAEEIQQQLRQLRASFEAIDDEWSTFRDHVKHAHDRAEDVDREFRQLRTEFERIDDLEPDLRQ